MTTSCNEEIYTLDRYLELKADGFQFEGESYLFWEYMRILTDIRKYNPDVLFLLENVEMGAKWERVLSEAIGIYGVHINSALVSAQNRKRIYWTNIKVREDGLFGELHSDIPQPEDRGILLKDILEDTVDEKYYITGRSMMDCVTDEWRLNKQYTQINGDKSLPQKARQYSNWNGDYVCCAMRGRNPDNPSDRTAGAPTKQRLEPNTSGKTNTLTSVQKDNLVMQINPSLESGGVQPYQQNRVYDINGIMPAVSAQLGGRNNILIPEATAKGPVLNRRQKNNHKHGNEKANSFLSTSWKGSQANGTTLVGNTRIRRLTPVECERLQTVKDNFTASVSDTQRYKMLGNGWTVEVIAHIFRHITH